MQFKLHHNTRLSPPTLFDTAEEAIAEGKKAFVIFDDHDNPTNRFENFLILEIRPATLGDFFDFRVLVGDLRERMSAKCGDDTALDKVGQDAELNVALADMLNDYGNERLDLSPYTIEVARRGVIDPSSLL